MEVNQAGWWFVPFWRKKKKRRRVSRRRYVVIGERIPFADGAFPVREATGFRELIESCTSFSYHSYSVGTGRWISDG